MRVRAPRSSAIHAQHFPANVDAVLEHGLGITSSCFRFATHVACECCFRFLLCILRLTCDADEVLVRTMGKPGSRECALRLELFALVAFEGFVGFLLRPVCLACDAEEVPVPTTIGKPGS